MGNLTIEDIRKLAELNLTPECYRSYLEIIEPNIKAIIPNYLKDWQGIELQIMLTTMRHAGVFKTSLSFHSIDENTEKIHGEEIDIKKFKEINAWKLWKKIKYLKDEGVLGENSFNLFNTLKEMRNKIHEPDTFFSEKDL